MVKLEKDTFNQYGYFSLPTGSLFGCDKMLHTTATNFTTSNTMLFHLLCSSSFGTIHINTTLMMHKEFVVLVESCGIINIILAFPTTVCNLSVIVVLCKSKNLLTVSNIPLLSLAVTDLLTGTISMPVYGSYLILIADKDLLCSLNLTCYFMGIILVMVSLLTVFLLALERYLAIVHTLFYRKHINKAIVVCLVIFIWLFVISFTLGTILSGKSAVLTNTSIAVIVLAYGWSAFVYCNIFLVVKRLRKHDVRPSLALPSSNMAKSSSRSYKTNRLSKFSGIVIAVLLFFYLPFVIAKVMSGYIKY